MTTVSSEGTAHKPMDSIGWCASLWAIAAAGACSVTPLVLHLRSGAREWYLAWLEREHPELLPRYRDLYGDGAYAPNAYQQGISVRVAALARRYGLGAAPVRVPRHARHTGDRALRF